MTVRSQPTDPPQRHHRRWSSSTLTRLGAVASLSFLLVLALTPLTTLLSVVSPPLYAIVASLSIAGPLFASSLVPRFGSALFVSLSTGAGLMAFTPLGPLALLALGLPTLVIEGVLAAGRAAARRSSAKLGNDRSADALSGSVWLLAAVLGGATIGLLSLPVIASEAMTPWLAPVIVGVRILSYVTIAWMMRRLRARLMKAGV